MGSSLCYRLPVSHLLTHLLIANSLISPTHIVGCYLPPAHTPTHTHTPTLATYSQYFDIFVTEKGLKHVFAAVDYQHRHTIGGEDLWRLAFVGTYTTHPPYCNTPDTTLSDHALLIDICLICPPYRDVGETPRTR